MRAGLKEGWGCFDATPATRTAVPDPGDLMINGVDLPFLDDYRIPFAGAIDPNGFPITDYCTLDEGPAAVEGYYAGGELNIFALEADATLPPGEDFVSVERARCRDGQRFEVRGFTTSTGGQVDVRWLDGSVGQQIVNITPDGLGGGEYRMRVVVAACPSAVMVEDLGTGETAEALVELRC